VLPATSGVVDTGNVPMGRASRSPIQMVAAYGAVANGGVMMKPHLTRRSRSSDTAGGRPADRSAAVPVQLPRHALRTWSPRHRHRARIPGYVVAGKTGTAQKALPNGGGTPRSNTWLVHRHGAGRDPQLVVAWSSTAAPLWARTVAAPAFPRCRYALQRLGSPVTRRVLISSAAELALSPPVLTAVASTAIRRRNRSLACNTRDVSADRFFLLRDEGRGHDSRPRRRRAGRSRWSVSDAALPVAGRRAGARAPCPHVGRVFGDPTRAPARAACHGTTAKPRRHLLAEIFAAAGLRRPFWTVVTACRVERPPRLTTANR